MDDIDEDGIVICCIWVDVFEIDGNLFIDEGIEKLLVGDIVNVEVDEVGEYDLWGILG